MEATTILSRTAYNYVDAHIIQAVPAWGELNVAKQRSRQWPIDHPVPAQVLPSHEVNEVFPSTHEGEEHEGEEHEGEEHEDITGTESEDSIDSQDGGNESPLPEVIEGVFFPCQKRCHEQKEIAGWCSGNKSDEFECVEEARDVTKYN